MLHRFEIRKPSLFSKTAPLRGVIGLIFMAVLVSCAAPAVREAELSAQAGERRAIEQEAAQLAQQQERERTAELQRQRQRQREQQAAEQARVQVERESQTAQVQMRADAERRERLARIAAAAEQERQQKIDRISALEQQIASVQAEAGDEEFRRGNLEEAILITEELLNALAVEQAKYENTDADGNTVEPLAKEFIAELELRKNALMRRANSQ